jgi:2-amino-4-hydroxy-6-hydroxymethyldihydropteridine diphosphokinase
VWKLSVFERILTELAFIALGSNIDPEKYLPLAALELRQLGNIIASSNVYQNPAITDEPQPDYLNAAVLIQTQLEPLEIRIYLRQIEQRLGRIRTADKYAARTIDLDLSLFGDLQMNTPELILPDPDILTRPHLARIMAELRPDYLYPGTDRTLEEIAGELTPRVTLLLRRDVYLLPDEFEQNKGSTNA